MLLLNIATALCAVSSTFIYRRRFRALSEDYATRMKMTEQASVDAAATALSLVDMLKDGGYQVEFEAVPPPVILGYGQTRSKDACYIYRDLRDADGIVRREFVQRIPFKAK